jgi:hypothetical protein
LRMGVSISSIIFTPGRISTSSPATGNFPDFHEDV